MGSCRGDGGEKDGETDRRSGPSQQSRSQHSRETRHHYISPEAVGADIPPAHLAFDCFFVAFSLLRPVVLLKKTSQELKLTPAHSHYPQLFKCLWLLYCLDFTTSYLQMFFKMGGTAWWSTVTLLTVGESLGRKPSCIRMVPKTNTHFMYPPLFFVRPTNNNKNKSKWRHNKSPSKTVTRIDFILLFATVIWGMLLISMYFTPPVVRLECNKTTNWHKWLLWNPADLPLMVT